jgi:hypothetical protein
MAAYNSLLMQNNVYVSGAMLIYLDKHGEFPDIESLDDEEMEEMFYVFSAALHCYKYFKIRKKKKDGTNREECVSAITCDNGRTDLHTKG